VRKWRFHKSNGFGSDRTRAPGDPGLAGAIGRLLIFSALVLIFVSGCAAVRAVFEQKPDESAQAAGAATDNKSGIPPQEKYLARASALAQKDELQKALTYLRIARASNPDDQAIAAQIAELEATCRQKAGTHLQAGVEQYGRKQFDDARRHFLIVLRYDPGNQKALGYLQRLIPSNYQSYKVQKGDTLKQVAKKIYQDPGKDFLIAYFNDLPSQRQPKPGTWLKLPYLEAEFAEPFFDIPGELAQARRFLTEERYGDVIGVTGKILAYDYLNKEAEALKHEAYYQMGLHLLRQSKYEAAMQMMDKVDPDHAGLAASLQDAHAREIEHAEQLLAGKAYARALTSAQRVLVYDPANQAAEDLLNRIRCKQGQDLVAEQKYAEAMAVLEQADPNNRCIAAIRAAIQTQAKTQAESHYLKGVKYFLVEDLQKAIAEWEQALKWDPGHVKAQHGIGNARHLLEQLDKVD